MDRSTELLYREESYFIRGAVYEVYREMGAGFLEAVYQECLEREMRIKQIPFVSQPTLQLFYKREQLIATYRPDLICYDKIIIELKAVSEITDAHRAQLHNYLKATGFRLGFIVNFGHYPKVAIERIVR